MTRADPYSEASRSRQSQCLEYQVLELGRTNRDDLGEQSQCTRGAFRKAVTWNNDNGYIPHRPCFWGVGVLHRTYCHQSM